MAEQYLYFRTATALADDDDSTNGSYLFPVSSFLGAGVVASSNTDLVLYFKGRINHLAHADATPALQRNDLVTITCATNGQKAFLQELTKAINGDRKYNQNGMITVFDGVTGEAMGACTAAVPTIVATQA
tara:strand:- start:469 stop:858 length:390 start_codon:yes stop_codon:yes gene_type:complete